MSSNELLAFARSFNYLLLTTNFEIASDIIEYGIIPDSMSDSPEWMQVLNDYPEIRRSINGLGRLNLPDAWTWESKDSRLHLINPLGESVYSWFYGLLTYTS